MRCCVPTSPWPQDRGAGPAPTSRTAALGGIPPSGSPGRDLRSRGEAQFAEDVFDVAFGGALGDHQPRGDLLVTQAFGDQLDDLTFAAGQGPLFVAHGWLRSG